MRNSILGVLAVGTVSLLVFQGIPAWNSLSDAGLFRQDSTKSRKGSTMHVSSNGRHMTTFSDGDRREEITYEGRIVVSKDFTDIESISPNGYLRYVSTVDDETRRLEIKSDSKGNLVRTYKENGNALAESAGSAYLRRIMPGLMAVTGIGVEEYIESIYRKSGIDGVFRAAEEVPGGHAKVVFIKQVFKQPGLKPSDFRKALKYASSFTDSDYERRNMLTAIPETAFGDVALVDDCLTFADKLKSDYESRLALQHILKSKNLNKSNLDKVLLQIDQLGSDYEKSNVLGQLIGRKDFLGDHYSGTLASVARIGSDYEKGRTLERLIKQHELNLGQYQELFPVVVSIRSDYEKGKVLQRIAPAIRDDAKVRESYQKAAGSIRSDYERKKALDALK